MITKDTKKKITKSFNNLMVAMSNFRNDVADSGSKAFKSGTPEDVYELAKLLTQVDELKNKMNKIAPCIKTYSLDISVEEVAQTLPIAATQSQLKELQSINNKKEELKLVEEQTIDFGYTDKKSALDLDSEECTDAERCVIRGDNNIIACFLLLKNKKVIILNGSIISDVMDDSISQRIIKKRESGLKNGILTKLNDTLNLRGYRLNTNIKLDSYNLAYQFIFGTKEQKYKPD